MRELRRLVHSPHHLFVFEVCGRLLSFTRAAEELGVSQPAVSLAIRQLETAIGQELFERRHRAIRLTDAGERFYNEVSLSMERLLQAAREVNRGDDEDLVTLSISTAFANYWVMPRLTRLVGMSTNGRSTRTALRMRVSISAIGSVIMVCQFPLLSLLPTGFTNTRDKSQIRVHTETDSAQTELAVDRSRTTAKLAAVLASGAELRFPVSLGDF